MSFDPTTTLETIQTHALSLTAFQNRVYIGTPPRAVAPEGLTAFISMESMAVATTTLVSTVELHVVQVRIYRAMASGSEYDIEAQRFTVLPQLMDLLKGDFQLGGGIRAIDWGGQYGVTPRVDFDEEELGDKPYWTAHLTLPLIVDPTAVFVA